MSNSQPAPVVVVGVNKVRITDVVKIAFQDAACQLSSDAKFLDKINRGPMTVRKLVGSGYMFYGVNTGLGDSVTVPIKGELQAEMSDHMIKFFGAGSGKPFSEEESRAITMARLVSLASGFSGVRLEVLQQLTSILNRNIVPIIPQEGSVGASGDLTPLSYLGAALCGYRDCVYQGKVVRSNVALEKAGLKPLYLQPKEALSLMNGTSAMTGVACLAYHRAQQVSQFATRLTSFVILSMKGNQFHYDQLLFTVKPHVGQTKIADRIREDLAMGQVQSTGMMMVEEGRNKEWRLQDRYSVRCAPHVIGVLEDVLGFAQKIIEIELNGCNDNPIVDVDTEKVLHGGMFYGGHIAMIMDTLKCQIASVADLLDRQMALLVDIKFNNNLPANLSGSVGPRSVINHGLKSLQISVSAWTAEALKLTLPAGIFSRSTECHNQDKVSMGTIAARDCIRILELTEQVIAAMMIAVRQAMTIRERRDGLTFSMSPSARAHFSEIVSNIPFMEEDYFVPPILDSLTTKLRNKPKLLYNSK